MKVAVLALALLAGCGTSRPPAPETPLPPEPAQGRFARTIASIEEHADGGVALRMLVGPGSLESDRVAVARIELGPDRRIGPAAHPCYDVAVVVLSGELMARDRGQHVWLEASDTYFIPRREVVDLATGDAPAVIYQVFSSAQGVAGCERLAATAAPDVGPPPEADALFRVERLRRRDDAVEIPIAGGKARVRMLVDSELQGATFAYVGTFEGDPGLAIPAHVHPSSDEVLVVETGQGTLTVAGEPVAVGAGMVVRVPAGTEHSFVATGSEPTRALQIYGPPGPEDRFRSR
ncbi:MAG: cupin domain-containing protein [Deltaproteobacteria bacterium]|nr:cupin domain-containing protein [Deltaproteobacteria bacterium]